MNDEPDNIVLSMLREMRKDLGDLKQGQKQTNERLSSIEHHVTGIVVSINRFNDDADGLRDRVRRIERRLDLVDDPADDSKA